MAGIKDLLAKVSGTIDQAKKGIKGLMAGKKRKPQEGNRKAGGYVHGKQQKYADLDEAGDISPKKKKKEN